MFYSWLRKRPKLFIVNAAWDNDAQVWVATSDDIPGLVTEADTREQLAEKLRVMIPELLEENGILSDLSKPELPVSLRYEERLQLRVAI